MEVLRRNARAMLGADGVTVVLREGDKCHYVDEEAIAPLWKGQRFSMGACISGWAMLHKQQVAIPDIYEDSRIPHDAYRPTFVRSLAMTPIAGADVVGALGAYWANRHEPTADELYVLSVLAAAAANAMENVRLIEEARAEAKRKDEFLAILGHELRNPLAPIANRLAALERHSGVTADVQDQLDGIRRHMVQFVRLLDDLLDIGRISTGKILLRRRRMDLRAAIDLAVEMAGPYIEGRRHRLHCNLPDQSIAVDGDLARLAQVFANVLNNAAKFTEPGGNIWIEAGRDGQQALVRIKDDGAGIAPEALPRIFEPFYQADASLDRTREGMGVGLSLGHDLVELHGGSIEAQSEGAGRGAEFVVRLSVTEAVEHPTATKSRPSAGGKRVLVVDDNRDAGESLAAVLRLDGHEALAVTSGEAALKTLESYRPEAMLLDLAMPRMDGYELVGHIRKRPEFADCPLIAISGYGQDQDRRRSKEVGFDGHLVKPVDLAALADLLAPVAAMTAPVDMH